jgi:hypothetical protein
VKHLLLASNVAGTPLPGVSAYDARVGGAGGAFRATTRCLTHRSAGVRRWLRGR